MSSSETRSQTGWQNGSPSSWGKGVAGIGAIAVAVLAGLARHADDVGRGLMRRGRGAMRHSDHVGPKILRNSDVPGDRTLRYSDEFGRYPDYRTSDSSQFSWPAGGSEPVSPRLKPAHEPDDFSQFPWAARQTDHTGPFPWAARETDDLPQFGFPEPDSTGAQKGVSEVPGPMGNRATPEHATESAGGRFLGTGNHTVRKLVRDVITQHGNDQDEDANGEND